LTTISFARMKAWNTAYVGQAGNIQSREILGAAPAIHTVGGVR
jgi:hypothetical protein